MKIFIPFNFSHEIYRPIGQNCIHNKALRNLVSLVYALGHDSEKTTLIYLSTLDTSAVDNANSEILAALEEWQIKGATDKKCVNTQKMSQATYLICD